MVKLERAQIVGVQSFLLLFWHFYLDSQKKLLFAPCLLSSIWVPLASVFACRVRTSSGMFLKRGRDKVVQTIEKRIADFTFIPVGRYAI